MPASTEVPLRNRSGKIVAYAMVDDEDAESVLAHRWSLTNGYPASRFGGRLWYLHRWLLGEPPGQTDHINRNKLDCRRSNLRTVSDAENKQNVPARGGTSRHRGVWWLECKQRWVAGFGCKQGHCHRRWFRTEREAAEYIAKWRRENLPFSVDEKLCSPTM